MSTKWRVKKIWYIYTQRDTFQPSKPWNLVVCTMAMEWRHSVKWGKPSMEQQILHDFTHRPRLKGISQTLSGIWSLAAEESVERSREWWKRLVNILLHQQDDNRLTICSTFLKVRINFECFYHKEMMNIRIYMLWFEYYSMYTFIKTLYGIYMVHAICINCQLKINTKNYLVLINKYIFIFL